MVKVSWKDLESLFLRKRFPKFCWFESAVASVLAFFSPEAPHLPAVMYSPEARRITLHLLDGSDQIFFSVPGDVLQTHSSGLLTKLLQSHA
jgi:hypothetical protein